jgi:beta-glucosidase
MDGDIHDGRVSSLLSTMTLEEKLGQLTMTGGRLVVTGPAKDGDAVTEIRRGRVGSYFNSYSVSDLHKVQRMAVEETRLGIPLLFCSDTLHGYRTLFPIPLAEAGSFDRNLWRSTAMAAASEASAQGFHVTFAPMIDVSRDPRWGRIAESPGEDPVVAAEYARAKVAGFQTPDRDGERGHLIACAKHFAGYGAVMSGREYAEVDVSERSLREIHLPAFRAAVEAGAGAIMPGLHDLNGMPMTANPRLLQKVLRQDWGFGGLVISDYDAVAELVKHGIAGSHAEAAALALKAGVDIDMSSGVYMQALPEALDRGLVEMAEIDHAVRRVLIVKSRLGLFDNPFLFADRSAWIESVPYRALARGAAARSTVVLKNAADFLPWRQPPARLAVVGPFAAHPVDQMGPWTAAGRTEETIDIVNGLRAAWPDTTIAYAPGVDWRGTEVEDLDRAVAAAAAADTVVLCLGEPSELSGECASRTQPDLPDAQLDLARGVLAAGKPVVLVLNCGRPLVMPSWLVDGVAALVIAWFPGTEGGRALADVLDGTVNPSARLAITWPADVGQIPIYYAMRPTGRPYVPSGAYVTGYREGPNSPLFSFGAGLSWSRFEVAGVKADRPYVEIDGSVEISVQVRNPSDRFGVDTLFLFIRDPVATVSRPQLQLKDFAKVALEPGETKRIVFRLDSSALEYLDADLKSRLDPGTIEVHVGHSAAEADRQKIEIQVIRQQAAR